MSTIGRLVCVVAARGVGQQGGQEGLRRARDDADGGADGGADARVATPNDAADRTVALPPGLAGAQRAPPHARADPPLAVPKIVKQKHNKR